MVRTADADNRHQSVGFRGTSTFIDEQMREMIFVNFSLCQTAGNGERAHNDAILVNLFQTWNRLFVEVRIVNYILISARTAYGCGVSKQSQAKQ